MFLTIILLYIILSFCIFLIYKNKRKTFLKDVIGTKDRNNNSQTNINNGKLQSDVWQIPGPISLPLIGTKWLYYWKYKMLKIHEAYEDLHKKYGDIVLEVTSTGTPIVSLYSRTDIEKVLRYPSRYPFRPPSEIIAFYRMTRPDRYSNAGLVNAQGMEWYHLRTKLTPNLTSRKVLIALIPALNEICDDLVELIKFKRDKNQLINNFEDIANSFGLEAVCCLILGRRMGYLAKTDTVDSKFRELAFAVNKLFTLNRDAYFGNGLWKYIPTKIYRDFVYYEEKVYTIISDIVDKALNEEKLEYKDNEVNSIFLSILQSDELDIREKKSGLIDFITAGIDTMAHTISFFFNHISKNKVAQSRISDEFANTDELISHESLSNATYTKACIQESYRLTPTAMCITRLLEEDYTLSGYNIKSGTFVICQTMRACHEDENFENAKQFIPERWLNTSTGEDDAGAKRMTVGSNASLVVLPFGIGRRTCPGKNFVELNMSLCVAKLIRAFQIEYISDLDIQFEFLLAPKTPVQIRFSDRF